MNVIEQLKQMAGKLEAFTSEPAKLSEIVKQSGLIGKDGSVIALHNDPQGPEQAKQDAGIIARTLGQVMMRKITGTDAAKRINAVLASGSLGEIKGKTKRSTRKRGGQSNPQKDIALLEEYEHGLDAGKWDSKADFARTKKVHRTTVTKAFDRAEKARKQKPKSNRSR